MKTKSKFLKLIIIALIISFVSCSEEEMIVQNEKENLELISPNGKKIADSESELIETLELPKNTQVVGIEYIEDGESVVALIEYDVDGILHKRALGFGEFNFEADELTISGFEDKNLVPSSGNTISCNGGENCTNFRVQATYDPDGTINVTCESACCTMTVRPVVTP